MRAGYARPRRRRPGRRWTTRTLTPRERERVGLHGPRAPPRRRQRRDHHRVLRDPSATTRDPGHRDPTCFPPFGNAFPGRLRDQPCRARARRSGDRRWNDREDGGTHPPVPVATSGAAMAIPVGPDPTAGPNPSRDRTIVPTGPGRSVSGANPRTPPRPRIHDHRADRERERRGELARPPRRGLGRRPGGERDRSLGREPPHDRGGRRARAGAGEASPRLGLGAGADAARRAPGDGRGARPVAGPDSQQRRAWSSCSAASSRPWPRSRSANR